MANHHSRTCVFQKCAVQKYMLLVAVLLAAGQCHAKPGEPGSYLERLQARTKAWRSELPFLQRTADQVAKRVVAGGSLYVAGPQSSFVQEMLGRSGGLMMVKAYAPSIALQENDTVIAAYTGTPEASATLLPDLLSKADAAHAKVLLFANTGIKSLATATGTTQVLPRQSFKDAENSSGSISLESVSNVIGLWAWTGEFVGACVRQGKMPAMFESGSMPGGSERNALYRSVAFHPLTNVTPEAARNLGKRYLDGLSGALENIRLHDRDQLARASALIRQAHAARGRVKIYYLGHMFPSELSGPMVPDWFVPTASIPLPGPAPSAPQALLQPQDVGLILGYQALPTALIDSAPDNSWIVATSHRPLAEFGRKVRHVYLNPYWEVQDATVEVPGYDVKILPISGIIDSAFYWQLVESSGAPNLN